MQNIETETYLPARFGFLRNFAFAKSEDTTLATLASWSLGLVVFTLAGFYFGTIAGHDNHPEGRHQDLNVAQMEQAIPFAIGGLVIGIVFALLVTFWYVPTKLRELEQEQGGH